MKRLFISFSGGETSGFMTQWLLKNRAQDYDEIQVVFANTGQEREETLDFIERCSKHFGFPTTWVEAVVHHGERRAPTHRVVDFSNASRNGEPFEEAITKYGIPNQAFPGCTRDIKLCPMKSYLRSVGWENGSYDTAIGIRNDERNRVRKKAMVEERIVYPLVYDLPMSKPDVNEFWRRQPFRLQLKGYEGNCKWCWKKSLRKHLTLASENPSYYDFPKQIEEKYGLVGPEFNKEGMQERVAGGYRRTFFRQGLSAKDILRMAQEEEFTSAEDDADKYPDYSTGEGYELDMVFSGCSEHCEVFHTDEELEADGMEVDMDKLDALLGDR